MTASRRTVEALLKVSVERNEALKFVKNVGAPTFEAML